jgi:hypothetical protein
MLFTLRVYYTRCIFTSSGVAPVTINLCQRLRIPGLEPTSDFFVIVYPSTLLILKERYYYSIQTHEEIHTELIYYVSRSITQSIYAIHYSFTVA